MGGKGDDKCKRKMDALVEAGVEVEPSPSLLGKMMLVKMKKASLA